MGLFAPNRPKGITKEELYYIRGELMHAPMGERLTDRQVEDIMEDLTQALDSDTMEELKYHWEQVSEQEAAAIERNAANNRGMQYTPKQVAHIKQVLDKYLSINKTRSII